MQDFSESKGFATEITKHQLLKKYHMLLPLSTSNLKD